MHISKGHIILPQDNALSLLLGPEKVKFTNESDFLWFHNELMFQKGTSSRGGEVSCHPLWTLTMEVSNTNGLSIIMRC